jgi:uncharacterized membrane protein YkvA (DUF1232 family)
MSAQATLDGFEKDLARVVEHQAGELEAKLGKNAATFFHALPGVFQVLRRAAMDLEAPSALRHLSASAALYLVESRDFLSVSSSGVSGWLDDVYVASLAFERLLDGMGEDRLEKHWRYEKVSFADGAALAHNVVALRGLMPSRILESVEKLLS